jgi:hypothetical protein
MEGEQSMPMQRSDAKRIAESILSGGLTRQGRIRSADRFLDDVQAAVKKGQCTDPRYCMRKALDTWLAVVTEGK